MSLYLKDKTFQKSNPNMRKIALVVNGKDNGKFIYYSDSAGGQSEIKMDKTGILQPLPNFKTHEKIYAAANSGAGKTYYISNFIKQWQKKKTNKDKPVYIFSAVEKDETLDSLPNVERIGIDSDLLDEPITLEDLAGSFVIFDDIDTISHPALKKVVLGLRDHACQAARHYDITMAMTSHVVSNYSKTRILLSEATSVTFFPKSSGSFQIRKYLETQGGFDKDQISKFLKQPSRWVTLYRQYNGYIVSEKNIYMVNTDD